MGLKDFHQQRSFLDDMIFEAKASNSPARKGLEKVRAIAWSSPSRPLLSVQRRLRNDAARSLQGSESGIPRGSVGGRGDGQGRQPQQREPGIGFSEQVGALTGAVLVAAGSPGS